MKKRTISFQSFFLISSFTIVFLTLIIFSFFSISITKKVTASNNKIFIQNYQQILRGYCQSIRYGLHSYNIALDYFEDRNFFATASTEQINKYLLNFQKKELDYIMSVFYVDKTGKAFTNKGLSFDASNREYFNKIINEGYSKYISDPIYSLTNSKPIIVISKAVKDNSDNVKGILCASVTLETLKNLVSEICISENASCFILDSQGRFIYHINPEKIMKTFTPENPEYEKYSTENIIKTKPEEFKLELSPGLIENIFFHGMEDTNWGIGLFVSHDVLQNEVRSIINNSIKILSATLLFVILLLALNNTIISIFQKNKIIQDKFDNLTGLLIRKKFEEYADRLLSHSPNSKYLVIETDIRGFKFINQNFGGHEADKIIIFYGNLLNKFCQEFKGYIAHGYADHFYGFFKVSSVRSAMEKFNSFLVNINNEIKKYDIPFTTKFGLAFYLPDPKSKKRGDIKTLLGQASFSKATIKDNALSQCAIYNSRLLKKVNQERYIEQHMEAALQNNEFFVMYQPKIQLSTDKIVGAEALVRWDSPKLGFMAPNSFIPLFEQNGFVTKLDFFVYEEVFKFLKKQIQTGQPVVPISVNMSRNHSRPEKFCHQFMEIFRKYDIPPELIQIEILERSVMHETNLLEITNLLHKAGFTVAMDDFGTGESSLNMLTKVPVDVLKFDRTFLLASTDANGDIDKKNANFIETLIELSRNLEKETIFEGVETEKQRDFLKSINCDLVQGYFYSKPLKEGDFIEFIKKYK